METESLISPKTRNGVSTKTFIITIIIAIVITGFVSNIDRIFWRNNANDNEMFGNEYVFGHSSKQHFLMDNNGLIEMNSGSLGNTPEYVLNYQISKRKERELCPTCYSANNEIDEVIQLLAEYLNVNDYKDLVLLWNASHGISAILNSIKQIIFNHKCGKYNNTCKLLSFTTRHTVVTQTLNFINNNIGSVNNQLIQFNVSIPMLVDTDLLLTELEEYIRQYNDTIYMGIVSHVGAWPSVVYDVKRICELFRKYNIISFIDAAHAMGQINVDLSDINCDIWLANGHKWFFSSFSSVMYVNKTYQDIIYPPIISTRGVSNGFYNRFGYQGTMSYDLWLSIKAGMEFRQFYGDNEIIQYNHNLCINASKIFENIWNTTLLINDPQYYGSFINPILPTQNITEINILRTIFNGQFNEYLNPNRTNTPIFQYNGVWFTRLSCQIFLELSDFEWIANKYIDVIKYIRQ